MPDLINKLKKRSPASAHEETLSLRPLSCVCRLNLKRPLSTGSRLFKRRFRTSKFFLQLLRHVHYLDCYLLHPCVCWTTSCLFLRAPHGRCVHVNSGLGLTSKTEGQISPPKPELNDHILTENTFICLLYNQDTLMFPGWDRKNRELNAYYVRPCSVSYNWMFALLFTLSHSQPVWGVWYEFSNAEPPNPSITHLVIQPSQP